MPILEALFAAIEKWPIFGWFLLGCGIFVLLWLILAAIKAYVEYLWHHPEDTIYAVFFVGMIVFAGLFVCVLNWMGKI